jgi:hypothetical protein
VAVLIIKLERKCVRGMGVIWEISVLIGLRIVLHI